MSDLQILQAGCVISFIAISGAYIYLRSCFTEGTLPPHEERMQQGEDGEDESTRNAA